MVRIHHGIIDIIYIKNLDTIQQLADSRSIYIISANRRRAITTEANLVSHRNS